VMSQLPAAPFDAAQGSMCLSRSQTLIQKSRPVVGLDGVQRGHYILEGVRFQSGCAAWTPVKGAAEIVQRFRSSTKLAQAHVGFKPDQRAFGVIIHAAAIL